MASTLTLALPRSVSLRSSSIYLPWRTSLTPAKPRPSRAWAMARPWGSSTPFFRVMCTRAFIVGAFSLLHWLLHGLWALHVARAALGKNSKPARHFLISLGDLAQVAAEAVLVQLFVCLDVPQAAAVRADLVGEHDAHVLALPETAELKLE